MKSMKENIEYIQNNSAGRLEELKNKCEYCNEDDNEENLQGSDGVLLNNATGEHYLFIEHFRNEQYRIRINYCPQCGRKFVK